VMRWCKEQGGVTGYPHSAMHVNAPSAAKRLLDQFDSNADGSLSPGESKQALLPTAFASMDEQKDGLLSLRELTAAIDQAADELPNYVVPEMNGAGAMEVFVTTAEGVCDFISAMDTARVPEWNTWYHLMNCGFPLKLSGETDFPCMSSRRVGQGRVYVRMGDVKEIDFETWCRGLAKGQSYVSDGFAHAIDFRVANQQPGEADVALTEPGKVMVTAKVAFAPETPRAVAYGLQDAPSGRRMSGDTVHLHAPRNDEWVAGGKRKVEVIVNGESVATFNVEADGKLHEIRYEASVDKSSWIAIRQFPQLHTNPVAVIVDKKPIRASRRSARWCAEAIQLLWKNRHTRIAVAERPAARAAYDRAIATYLRIAKESSE